MFQSPLYYIISAPLYKALVAWAPPESILPVLRLIPFLCGALQVEVCYRALKIVFPGRDDLQAMGTVVWRLTNGRAITPQSQFGGETTSLLVGQPIDMYLTDVTPQVLTMRRYRQYATMLSLNQIREMMSDVGGPGVVDTDALVRLWFARFTAVLINMLVLVLTLPFFLLREPANLLRQSVLCAGAAIPAMLGALLALAVDLPGIPPAAGVFLPALVLIPVAMFMVTLIKT